MLRDAAAHLRRHYFNPQSPDRWSKDSPAEFADLLTEMHTHADCVTVHIYPTQPVRWGLNMSNTSAWLLLAALGAASAANKPLYLGEFGQPLNESCVTCPRPYVDAVLEVVKAHNTTSLFSTVWVWQFVGQNHSGNTVWSIGPGRDDKVIEMLQAADRPDA